MVESNGISGSPTSLPTLCPDALPWPPVCSVGGVATRGRPDAWPWLGVHLSKTSYIFNEGTSGLLNQTSQFSTHQSCVVLPFYQQQTLPVVPAYCFHCLQFGSVFTTNPV